MGQYYYVVNVTKRQYLDPHAFGDGLKLREFGFNSDGTMSGLAILLADGNGRGMGDVKGNSSVIGSWAGDQIVIAGDYGDKGKFTDDPELNLHKIAVRDFEDISDRVKRAFPSD